MDWKKAKAQAVRDIVDTLDTDDMVRLYNEMAERWCGDVSADEYEGEDSYLDNVTLYDYPLYGPSYELLAFCSEHGVDMSEQWDRQKRFDKAAQEAVRRVW